MEPTVNTLTTEHVNWIAGPLTDGASQVQVMEFDATGERNIAAFEELVGRCEVKAYRLAMQLVGSESDAQGILQETFLSAWQNAPRFTGTMQFDRWVYRTVGRAAVRRLNTVTHLGTASAGKHRPSFRANPKLWIWLRAEEDPQWSTRPADQLRSEDLYRSIRKAVDALPHEPRMVFILCDLEEMSVADGAEILDLSVAQTKEHLQAARLAIRHAIGLYFSGGVHDSASTSVCAGNDNRHMSEASITDP